LATPQDIPYSGIFRKTPRLEVIRKLTDRARQRLEASSDAQIRDLLEDAVYHERLRMDRHGGTEREQRRVDNAAKAIVRGDRIDQIEASLRLVEAWADEVHGRFDAKVYQVASKLVPRGVDALLAHNPLNLRALLSERPRRLEVRGDVGWLRELADTTTLVLVPTHVSNLDSPLIGWALTLAGLPPFLYGAGLNLFSNPLLGWWMSRLGAYTVDRTKRSRIYKQVLKDYSVVQLKDRHHSLFFPGGTRSRSGSLERKLKKGLMGTGIQAWQESLAAGADVPDILFVPLNLSFQLVLEANTLIRDYLAEAGKQRFIITDDESAQPKAIWTFFRRVAELDARVVAHFGTPLDVFGNELPRDPAASKAHLKRVRGFVQSRGGETQRDPQRDQIYTERLAKAIAAQYPNLTAPQTTNIAAAAAWNALRDRSLSADPFRLVRAGLTERELPREDVLARIGGLIKQLNARAAEGRLSGPVEESAEAVLSNALISFSKYHRTRAMRAEGDRIVIEDPKLLMYYRNRLDFLDGA